MHTDPQGDYRFVDLGEGFYFHGLKSACFEWIGPHKFQLGSYEKRHAFCVKYVHVISLLHISKTSHSPICI